MSATTMTRPPTQSGPAPSTKGPGGWSSALLSVVTVGVLAGGVWGLTAPRESAGDGHDHGSSAVATVALPDGTLRVDGLVDRQVGHVMPGMSMSDDVPVGMRRFAVDVSLGATEDAALQYDQRDFTVSGPGVEPVVPVAGQIDSGSLTPGSTISGSLSFDVPEDATALTLRFRDSADVTLPTLPDAGGEHDEHGGAEAPAKAPAESPAPAGEHHDAPGAAPHDH